MLKKTAIASVIALTLTGIPQLSVATGIPTVDAASLIQLAANAKQQADEALAQLNKAKEAIQQAKSQYDHYKGLVTGNNKLGDFLNDPALNNILPLSGWQDLYNNTKNLADLRKRYGLTSSDPNVQAKFDQLLQQAGVLEDTYDGLSQRVKNAEQLRQKLNSVETPQQREELGLRYQQEQLELQTQQIRLQNAKMLMDEQEKIEDKKRAQDFWLHLQGKSSS